GVAFDQLPELSNPRRRCPTAERMFDTIILLAGVIERPVLRSLLLGHNPHLVVIPVETRNDLFALSLDQLRRSRLIAYVTPEIVPASILAELGYGAFNFHP